MRTLKFTLVLFSILFLGIVFLLSACNKESFDEVKDAIPTLPELADFDFSNLDCINEDTDGFIFAHSTRALCNQESPKFYIDARLYDNTGESYNAGTLTINSQKIPFVNTESRYKYRGSEIDDLTFNIVLKDKRTTVFSSTNQIPSALFMSVPEHLSASPPFNLNTSNNMISWSNSGSSDSYLGILLTYNPHVLGNIDIGGEIVTNTKLIDADLGTYQFQQGDFAEIPIGALVEIKVLKISCEIISDSALDFTLISSTGVQYAYDYQGVE